MRGLVKEPLDYLCGMSDSQLFEVVSASSRGLSMRSSKSGRLLLGCEGGEFYSKMGKIREKIFGNPVYPPSIKAFMDK